MKNIVIIGSPRAGKSSLTNLLVDKYEYQVIREDTLRKAFDIVFPQLGISSKTAIDHQLFKEFIQALLASNMRYPRNKHAYVIEGCDITIEDYQKYFQDENTILCVLGLCDITPESLLENIRHYDTNTDWSSNYDDEYMLKKCESYIEYSKKNKQLCQQYNLNYFETSSHNREKILNQIVKVIEKDI